MKEIKDYLHFYLGCDCEHDCWLDADDDIPGETKGRKVSKLNLHMLLSLDFFKPKPILRPLLDIRKLEIETSIAFDNTNLDKWIRGAERTKYLLSLRFDLFGLIKDGLAIDATTLTP